MAPPTLSDYLKKEGAQVKNLQTLLNHYGELYQFYSDKLPNNKYINFLEENLFKDGFSTMPPAVFDFISLRPDQMSLLKPYVRFYKVFRLKNNSTKQFEIPFENKTDLSSIEDPQAYIGTPFPFAAQRFNGPIALLESVSIREGADTGRGTTIREITFARVGINIFLQDAKLLFKNWGDKQYPIFYKDFIAAQTRSKSRGILGTHLRMDLGYNVPDDASPELRAIAMTKTSFKLFPVGLANNLNYNEEGTLSFSVDLKAEFDVLHDDINVLNPKYYKKVRQANNMLVIEDEKDFSVDELEKKINDLNNREVTVKDELKKEKTKVDEKIDTKDPFIKKQEAVDNKRTETQLAKSSGAIPNTFSFITALYEAGLIYYFEIDNDTYKDYIQKIAKNQPVDVSDINFLPKRKKKTRIQPVDSLKNNPSKDSYFANTLRIKQFNTEEEEPTTFERVKFFYFGDLVDIMLNNAKGSGIGQDLDELGGEKQFSYLFGPILWVKNAKTKVVYNILNTPISLDMFMFQLNREIYQRQRENMGLNEFFSVFMKKFFDITMFGYEKAVAGKFIQEYTGKVSYIIDADKFNGSGSKFKQKISTFLPTSDTRDLFSAKLITAIPIELKRKLKKKSSQNIPIVYIGGPDKGPVRSANFSLSPEQGRAERELAKQIRGNVRTRDSIDDPLADGFMTSYLTNVNLRIMGNPFFRIGDLFFVDSIFVDGGFFLRKENKIFLTGYYRIQTINHDFSDAAEWFTNISAVHVGEPQENDSYSSFSGELPKLQSVNIADEANINRQAAIDIAAETSSVDKKPNAAIQGKASSGSTETPEAANPLSVSKK